MDWKSSCLARDSTMHNLVKLTLRSMGTTVSAYGNKACKVRHSSVLCMPTFPYTYIPQAKSVQLWYQNVSTTNTNVNLHIGVNSVYLELSSSERSSLNILSFLNCSKNASLFRSLSNWLHVDSNSYTWTHRTTRMRLTHRYTNRSSFIPFGQQDSVQVFLRTVEILVWFANMRPLTRLTRWSDWGFLDKATCTNTMTYSIRQYLE